MRTIVTGLATALIGTMLLSAAAVAEDTTTKTPVSGQVAKGKSAATYTEVSPGVWVPGKPIKPIYSGAMPIYPEAHEYLVPGSGGR
ncbi:MAG: hypothetical protein HY246_02420 [Proteobacteria bacterium]|nr:hypothetical protein [Pseudomonadota bacterium]